MMDIQDNKEEDDMGGMDELLAMTSKDAFMRSIAQEMVASLLGEDEEEEDDDDESLLMAFQERLRANRKKLKALKKKKKLQKELDRKRSQANKGTDSSQRSGTSSATPSERESVSGHGGGGSSAGISNGSQMMSVDEVKRHVLESIPAHLRDQIPASTWSEIFGSTTHSSRGGSTAGASGGSRDRLLRGPPEDADDEEDDIDDSFVGDHRVGKVMRVNHNDDDIADDMSDITGLTRDFPRSVAGQDSPKKYSNKVGYSNDNTTRFSDSTGPTADPSLSNHNEEQQQNEVRKLVSRPSLESDIVSMQSGHLTEPRRSGGSSTPVTMGRPPNSALRNLPLEEEIDEQDYEDDEEYDAMGSGPMQSSRRSQEGSYSRSHASKRSTHSSRRADRIVLQEVHIPIKKVVFDHVEVRHYERIMTDNPSVQAGVAVGIGWRYKRGRRMDIDDFEKKKDAFIPRTSSELALTRKEREDILRELGYSQKEMADMTRHILKSKNQRKQTVNNLHAAGMEEAVEKARGKFKRILGFGVSKKMVKSK